MGMQGAEDGVAVVRAWFLLSYCFLTQETLFCIVSLHTGVKMFYLFFYHIIIIIIIFFN